MSWHVGKAAIVSIGLAATAWASDAAHETHEPASVTSLLFPVLNFLLFAAILARFAWPAVRDGLRLRRERIIREIEEAATARGEAEAELEKVKTLVQGQREESERLIRDLRSEAERQREAIARAAAEAADRIRRDADLHVESEGAETRRALIREVADRAVDRATEALRDRIKKKEHTRFVDVFVSDLGGTPS